MALVARWPLHPQPQPQESLSSWLGRLAHEYDLSVGDLLQTGLGVSPLASHDLDRDPSGEMLGQLAAHTGLAVSRVRAMTLRGYVPWIIDTLDVQDGSCLAYYVGQYRVLLPSPPGELSTRVRTRKHGIYCLPWLVEPYGQEHLVCPECLRTDAVPHERIFWRLGIMASCPVHHCLLRACGAPTHQPSEAADDRLLTVDRFTYQGLTTGVVSLTPDVSMSVAVYVRFLRSLVEELFCPGYRAGRSKRALVALWATVEATPWTGIPRAAPFERLSLAARRAALCLAGGLLQAVPTSLTQWQCRPVGARDARRLPGALAAAIEHTTRRNGAWPQLSLRNALAAVEYAIRTSDAEARAYVAFVSHCCPGMTEEKAWQFVAELRASPTHPATAAPSV